MVHSELCSNRGPLDIVDEEGRGMVVGVLSITCLSAIKGSLMHCASFAVPKLLNSPTLWLPMHPVLRSVES